MVTARILACLTVLVAVGALSSVENVQLQQGRVSCRASGTLRVILPVLSQCRAQIRSYSSYSVHKKQSLDRISTVCGTMITKRQFPLYSLRDLRANEVVHVAQYSVVILE